MVSMYANDMICLGQYSWLYDMAPENEQQMGIRAAALGRLLLSALPTVMVSINPVPKAAPWRYTGPPIGSIVFNCVLIALAIGVALPLIKYRGNLVVRLFALLLIGINMCYAIVLVYCYY